MTKVLAIGAHHDDVELGCGGTLLAWRDQGHEVTIFTATRSGYHDPRGVEVRSDAVARAEGVTAATIIGARLVTADFATFELEFAEPLNAKLMEVLATTAPDVVLTHWPGDTHHDHRSLALATLQCCRHVRRVLTYCSSWYEGHERFDPRFFVDVSATLARKLELIATYRSENERTGGQWIEFARAQAALMGLKAGVSSAEAFEVVKWLA